MGLYEKIFGGGVRSITPEQAYELLQSNPNSLIVDVRQPIETRSGAIPDAELIPLTELGQHLQELPPQKLILTICRSGHRSPIAARQLKKAGFETLNVTGGVLAWKEAGLPFTSNDTTEN